MTDAEHHHHHQRLLRFARIRRLKLLLRYMPRRARFHTYPLVGRFAAFARKRSYLWTFRYAQIRPSLYLGSILTLIPIPGQLPIAFFLCLGFRANFMVMGGLQFVSNPVTSLPFFFGTYKLGAAILDITGISANKEVPVTAPDLDFSQPLALPAPEPAPDASSAQKPAEPGGKGKKSWTDLIYEVFGDHLPPRGQPLTVRDCIHLLGHGFAAVLIGATLAGLALGFVLDLLWRTLVLPAAKLRAARKPITALVTPHDNPPPDNP